MPRRISFADACRMYVHRYTLDHVPAWAEDEREDGTYYAPHYASDAEWYANTLFPPENPFSKKHCHSTGLTWPMGKSLSSPLTHARI